MSGNETSKGEGTNAWGVLNLHVGKKCCCSPGRWEIQVAFRGYKGKGFLFLSILVFQFEAASVSSRLIYMKFFYFDNAATSWPKPTSVIKTMKHFFYDIGGNPGRSGHTKSIEAGQRVLKTRESLASLFSIEDPARLVFTKNATEALNIALTGFLQSGDHVVTTSMEHNSVMRPLHHLRDSGIQVSVAEASEKGRISLEKIKGEVKKNTKLVAVTHASNVTGTINDLESIGNLCSRNNIILLVDAAQTAGVVPIDVKQMHIDLLAFSGHKGLLGPQGTGGLYIGGRVKILPLMRGGTGSLSDREEQPDFFPDCYESGTLNAIGLAGLGAGIDFIRKRGIETIFQHDGRLLEIFLDTVSTNRRITLYGMCSPSRQTGVVSLNVQHLSPSKVGDVLNRKYGILTRIGLHCAPRAHKTIGTFPDGTVRLSWGVFTRESDVRKAAEALKKIAETKTGRQIR
jgi:cysteine desulfurase family protein